MTRSLKLYNDDKDISITSIPSEGDDDDIVVTVCVDDIKDNNAFTIGNVLGNWFSYAVEWDFNNKQYVIKIIAAPNPSVIKRYGSIEIVHKAVNILRTINLEQDGAVYDLSIANNQVWRFHSLNKENDYEEQTVTINAEGGSKKWYVKEIQKYMTLANDVFDDIQEVYTDTEDQKAQIEQYRMPYDNAFTYKIDGNALTIRSYGQIDTLTPKRKGGDCGTPHIRYFVVIGHADVDNSTDMEIEMLGDDYEYNTEIKVLLIFDGDFQDATYKKEETKEPAS